MKLSSFFLNDSVSCGIVTDSGILDIPSNTEGANKLHSIKEILTKGPAAYEVLAKLAESVEERIPLEDVQLLAPLPQPGKILALAGNYKKHLEESVWQDKTFDDQSTTTNPWPFMMPSSVITATNTEIAWPAYSEQVDYEIELAIVIGQTIKCVSPEQATTAIAGYTIANDISARSTTFKEGRKDRPRDAYFDWLMGKWSDGFMPLGPWIVTADEVPDPQNLNISMSLNGRVMQESNTANMVFGVAELVSYLSQTMTLLPGDVLLTGTPPGVGAGRDPQVFIAAGDSLKVEVELIGVLENRAAG